MKKSYWKIAILFLFVLGFISCEVNVPGSNQEIDIQVQYYFQNIENNDYTLGETEIVKGKISSFSDVKAPEYTGFIAKEVDKKKINYDENIIPIYYDRIVTNVVLHSNSGSFDGQEKITLEGRYEQDIDYRIPTKEEAVFVGWTDVAGKEIQINKFGTESIDLYASWESYITNNLVFDICDGTWAIEYVVPKTYREGFETQLPSAERDFCKQGYIFDGWYTDKEYSASNKIDKIETFTKGNLELYAKWIPAIDTPYKVIHKLQTVDMEGFEEDCVENKTGVTNEDAVVELKKHDGFTGKYTNKEIKPDGSTEVEVLYYRKQIKVTYISGLKDPVTQTGYYGQTFEEPDLTEPGYTVECNSTFTSYPSEDKNIFIVYTANKDTEYTIVTRIQKIDGKTYEETETTGTGTTGSTTRYTAERKDGFSDPVIIQTRIKGDGSGKVTVTYDRKTITLIYSDGINKSISRTGLYGARIDVPEFSIQGYKTSYSKNLTTFPETSRCIKVTYDSDSNILVNKSWQVQNALYTYLKIIKSSGHPFIVDNTIYLENLSDIEINFTPQTYSEGTGSGCSATFSKAELEKITVSSNPSYDYYIYRVYLMKSSGYSASETSQLLGTYYIRFLKYSY